MKTLNGRPRPDKELILNILFMAYMVNIKNNYIIWSECQSNKLFIHLFTKYIYINKQI